MPRQSGFGRADRGGAKEMQMNRRNFVTGAAYSMLATTIPNLKAHSSDYFPNLHSDQDTGSRQEVAAEVVRIMEKHGTHRHPSQGHYYSGYGDSLFTIETFFDNIALLHAGDTELGKNALRIYLEHQRQDGFIPRHCPGLTKDPSDSVWLIYESEEHAQPFLFQMALFLTRASGGDTSWITGEMYKKLKNYLTHWITVWDRDSNGLSEWASAQHASADTQFDRAGLWRSFYCEGADLNSFLYLDCLAAEKIALAKGFQDDAINFANEARRKKELIQKLLWDQKDGFFYDRDIRTDKRIRVKSVTGLYSLWAGIPDQEQAKRVVDEHILNSKEFWSDYPLPSYAMNERNYTQHHVPPPLIDIYYALEEGHSNWRGGLWPHANYFVAHGLQRYGFQREARLLAQKGYELAAQDKSIREWYDAETGAALGAHALYAGAQILLRFLPTEIDTGFDPQLVDNADKPLNDDKVRTALALKGHFAI
jgi:glycogen debranching enzyme